MFSVTITAASQYCTIVLVDYSNTFNLQIIISAIGEGVAVPVYVEEEVCVCDMCASEYYNYL